MRKQVTERGVPVRDPIRYTPESSTRITYNTVTAAAIPAIEAAFCSWQATYAGTLYNIVITMNGITNETVTPTVVIQCSDAFVFRCTLNSFVTGSVTQTIPGRFPMAVGKQFYITNPQAEAAVDVIVTFTFEI